MRRHALAAALGLAACGGLPFGNDAGTNDAGGTMDAGFKCDPAEPQPALCAYGEYCHSSTQCRDVQKGTCSNFPMSHAALSWNATTSVGPIIWEAIDESPDDATKCTAGTAYTVTLKAYTTTTFPTNKSALMGAFHLSTTGMENDLTSVIEQMNYAVSQDMKNVTMKFTLCSTVSSMSLVAGFYFTGGNPFCITLAHN